MASLWVLAFDHEGRPVQFDTWLDDLQLYLLSDSKDSVSLFDLASGAATSPPATADTQALYDAVVARYLSPATAALGRLLLPYLFPELSAISTVEDLHLLAVETSAVAVGAAHGTPTLLLLTLATPSLGLVAVGLALGVSVLGVASVSSNSVGARPRLPNSFTCGRLHTQHRCFSRLEDAWRAEFGDDVELPRWADLLKSRIGIFDQDFDAILSSMYGLFVLVSLVLPGTAPAEALHTFTLDSCASRCFFRDNTTLTPLPALVPVRLADPSGGPVMARSFTVLPCPAVPFGSLSDLHLPSFSTNLVSTAALHDAMVTTTTPGGQRVLICMCTRMGRHLATFTRRPGSSLYTLATEPSQVAASAQSPQVSAPPCLPCVEGRQRAAPHSSSFPPTTAPLQTLHMDVWGPARVSGQSRECYFLLVVDNYTRYTTVFPLRNKGQVVDVLIPWIHTVRLQLREWFGQDLPVLRLHSSRGGEFSSNLLRDFCHGEGILQSFTLPDSPQKNEIAERRIGLVMEAVHHLNLWPRVSLPETSPTLRWTGEVGDASVFWVWGSRAFVRDTLADKPSPRAIPCVFLGFVPDAPGWRSLWRVVSVM
ncbi:unnamed protein product [Closterium sp. NIES-54]